MQKSTWKLASLGGVAALMVGAAVVVAGCGDDPAAVPDPGPAQQQCGTTVVGMHGQACTEEGKVCPVSLKCDAETNQVANCTCYGGQFYCTDPAGYDYDESGWEPLCIELEPKPSVDCGASAKAIEGRGCDVIRATCHFTAPLCEGSNIGGYDICDCRLNNEGNQVWACVYNSCGESDVFEPDAGGSSSGGSSSGGSSSGGADAGDAGND